MPLDAILLSLALSLGGDARRGTKPIDPAEVNPAAVRGFLYRPAYSVDKAPRLPARPFEPEPGDVLLLSNPTPVFTTLYALAGTGKPGHSAVVVRLPDGQLGLWEAGFNDVGWQRVVPLEFRLNHYPGTVWVRKRKVPLTDEQSARLSEFVRLSADIRYNTPAFALQLSPVRARGPLRTFFVGRPVGPGQRYYCAQASVEALVYAGLVDGRAARPAATYPKDLFFDRSPNPHIDRHPLLVCDWEPPALWTRCPAGACCPAYLRLPYSAFLRPGVYHPPPELIVEPGR